MLLRLLGHHLGRRRDLSPQGGVVLGGRHSQYIKPIASGEQVQSFRTLLKRYWLNQTIATSHAVRDGPPWYFELVSDVLPSNAPVGTLAHLLTSCYALERGGANVKLCYNIEAVLRFIAGKFYALQMSQNTWFVSRVLSDTPTGYSTGNGLLDDTGLDGVLIGGDGVISWPVFCVPPQSNERNTTFLRYKFRITQISYDFGDDMRFSGKIALQEWVSAGPDYTLIGYLGPPALWEK